MSIINDIRKKREEKGYSQDYMADSLGITVKTYARLENGQGRLIVKIIDDISKILQVSPYDLVKFEDIPNTNGNGQANGEELSSFFNEHTDTILQLHKERIKHLESEIIYLRHIIEKKIIPSN